MKATELVKRNQNSTRKTLYDWDIHFGKMELDQRKKTDAIKNLNPPMISKTLKSFPGVIQNFAKIIRNLSEKTDNMKQLLKKEQNGFGWQSGMQLSTT